MIKTDALAEDVLAQQKLTWDSVPEPGQSVILRLTQSVSSGGDLLPLTTRVSAQIRHMSEALAEGLGYDGPLGLDVLTDQIETDGAQAIICETNPQPALFGALYPPKGAPFDGPAQIIREVFGPAPKPKARPRDWIIETHGTQAEELENACAALPLDASVQLVVQQGGLIHARGTKTQMNSVMAGLLDPARAPRFVDRAVLRPADPRKHAWPAAKSKKLLELTPPRREAPLRQSDCLSLLAPQDGLQVTGTDAEGYTVHDEAQSRHVSAQLNAWLTTALASDGGHMALRHRLACAGFPLSPKLVVKRDDLKTARRYVARQAHPCLLELWSRGDQIVCGPVKNAKALDRKISRYGSRKTKQIVLIPQVPEQVLDVLVFRGVTYGAAHDRPVTRVKDAHFDWSRLAEQVVAVLPGALCVCVRFNLQDPETSSAHQTWSVETIDADPDLARFGFEASSAATSLSKRIVKEQLAQAI